MVQPLRPTVARAAASRLAIQILRIASIGAQKRLPLVAAFLHFSSKKRLVSHYWFFAVGRSWLGRGRDQRVEWNKTLFRLLSQHMLAIEPRHLGVFRVLLDFRVACHQLFLTRILGNSQLIERVVGRGHHMLLVKQERVLCIAHADLLSTGKDLVPTVLLVP